MTGIVSKRETPANDNSRPVICAPPKFSRHKKMWAWCGLRRSLPSSPLPASFWSPILKPHLQMKMVLPNFQRVREDKLKLESMRAVKEKKQSVGLPITNKIFANQISLQFLYHVWFGSCLGAHSSFVEWKLQMHIRLLRRKQRNWNVATAVAFAFALSNGNS